MLEHLFCSKYKFSIFITFNIYKIRDVTFLYTTIFMSTFSVNWISTTRISFTINWSLGESEKLRDQKVETSHFFWKKIRNL